MNSRKGRGWSIRSIYNRGCEEDAGGPGGGKPVKKEQYFRHDWSACYRHCPGGYIYPGMRHLFMTVLLHGKRSGNVEHSRYVAGSAG